MVWTWLIFFMPWSWWMGGHGSVVLSRAGFVNQPDLGVITEAEECEEFLYFCGYLSRERMNPLAAAAIFWLHEKKMQMILQNPLQFLNRRIYSLTAAGSYIHNLVPSTLNLTKVFLWRWESEMSIFMNYPFVFIFLSHVIISEQAPSYDSCCYGITTPAHTPCAC